ncbi:hypothetical protein ONZ43_g6310 [Nemania bipapillata]|uniref:Uncharacterized protein n=1 Tax=Nemania bipapillata TaxID=110536 RepID=A0ACC2I0S7_9PEZI|nr:hypothetical protein ONZ43_g6310 [Nemania bipapillata]
MCSKLGYDKKGGFLADARGDLDRILQSVSEDVANAINSATASDIQKIGPDSYFIDKWRILRPLYKQLAGNVADYCKMLLRLNDIECLVYARAKEVDSARRTLKRRIEWGDVHQQPIRTLKDMFSEMHDLSGTMIVVNQPKMDVVNKIIKEFFEEVGNQTDWEAPAQHISSLGNHRSYNHHVTLSKTKYHEAVKFEIQVVSYQTHTYSMVSHDWEYKGMHGPLEEKDKFVLEILKSTGCTYDLVSQYFEQKKAEVSTSVGQQHDIYFASQELDGPMPIDLTIEQGANSTVVNKSEISWQQVRDDIAALSLALHHNTSLLQQLDSNTKVWGTEIVGNPYITTKLYTSATGRLGRPSTSQKDIRDVHRPEQHFARRKRKTNFCLSSQVNKNNTHNQFHDTLRASARGDKLDKTDIPATQLTTLQTSDNTWTAVPECMYPKSTMRYPDLPTETWVRSVTSFKPLHYGHNWIFGTLIISTTAVSRGNSGSDEKEEESRSIKYIPPRWISSRGVAYIKTTIKLRNLHTQSNPSFRLRTINIVPWDSDMLEACHNWEFAKIYDLFKTGKASPFDMDESGRNVLGYLSVGPAYFFQSLQKPLKGNPSASDVNTIVKATRALEEFVELVKRLTEWGIDASEIELNDV